MKLKRKNNKIFKFIVVIILMVFINLRYLNNKMLPNLEKIIEGSVKKEIYNYIFSMFDRDILEDNDILDVIVLNTNSNDEVVSVDYNYSLAYRLLTDSMDKLYDNLNKIEFLISYGYRKNGIYFVPIGLVYNNMFLDNLGFKVPCIINYVSDIGVGFNTRVSNYGMNNLLIELYLNIDIDNEIVVPSSFYSFGEDYEIVIASKVVMGRIPYYLGNDIEQSSSIVSS